MPDLLPLRDLVRRRFAWGAWERLIAENGCTIDRPYRSRHPHFPDIIYPLDYGYVNGTQAGDAAEVDIFVGSARPGLNGLVMTRDYRRGDREYKLLYACTPEEIYLANGFLNFDPALMEGVLVLREPMHRLWEE